MSEPAKKEGGVPAGAASTFPRPTNGTGSDGRAVLTFPENFEKSGKNNISIGRVGELAVCLDLARRGYDAISNPFAAAPYDILADMREYGIVRIQVKATSDFSVHKKTSRKKSRRYTFALRRGSDHYKAAGVDWFAFVVLSTSSIMYAPVRAIRTAEGSRKAFGVPTFEASAVASFEACLKQWELLR